MCAGAGTSVSSRLSVNSFNHSGRSRNRSPDARLLSLFVFLFGFFFVNRASFLVPDRHIALLLDLKIYLMSPAVAMQKTNWYHDLTTIHGQQDILEDETHCETKPTSGTDMQKKLERIPGRARQNESMLCHLKQTPATWRHIQKAHERNHAELPT